MSTDIGDILFVAQIEVQSDYLKSQDCSGAIMYCAVWSDTIEAAKERIGELLAQEAIRIANVEFIESWEDYCSGTDFKGEGVWKEMLEAAAEYEVWFGTMYPFE